MSWSWIKVVDILLCLNQKEGINIGDTLLPTPPPTQSDGVYQLATNSISTIETMLYFAVKFVGIVNIKWFFLLVICCCDCCCTKIKINGLNAHEWLHFANNLTGQPKATISWDTRILINSISPFFVLNLLYRICTVIIMKDYNCNYTPTWLLLLMLNAT